MRHKRKIELLAPGGDIDSIKAAILSGADAVYCGLNKFNARNRATNIDFDDLNGILKLTHSFDCKVFITLNIIIVESEIPDLFRFLNKLINTNIDGLIIQDLGLFFILNKYFKVFKIHASTQLTTHNEGQIKFLKKLNASRVNFSRELNIYEIKHLSSIAHNQNILTEVFVHGSYCISFSGVCFMSSVHGGNSGNRGRCSQPCRDKYLETPIGKNFPLNLKDNSAYFNLKALQDAGVNSIKIEGRIKKFHYVFTVVDAYRKQLNNLYKNTLSRDDNALYKVFNRDFSNAFLKGKISKDMFIDNPRNHSALHLAKSKNGILEENLELAKKEVNEETASLISSIKSKINKLSLAKSALTISIFGEVGAKLMVSVQTPNTSFVEKSETTLINTEKNKLDEKSVLKRLKLINDTEYFIENLNLENLHENLFIPFKELTAITKRIIFILNGSKENIAPIKLPFIQKDNNLEVNASLSVLISSDKDLNLCNESYVDIYFQLPNSFKEKVSYFIELFERNKNLIPWFPSILIGEDYDAAIELLQQIKVKHIVTNNTGITFEADKLKISWIAGPFLNIVNSYSLLSLKEFTYCIGSFISNELSKFQIKGIKKPKHFKLFYSIYHPIELMISRQCFFHQVTGCEKQVVDNECIKSCIKNATITNLKNNTFFIEKSEGNFNRIYNEENFLNTGIVKDVPNTFSSFFIDLRNIKTKTKVEIDKIQLISLFKQYIIGKEEASEKLNEHIKFTSDTQYRKGI